MFNIPELDDVVFAQLDHQSKLQCAVVNKEWHQVATQFIWQEIDFSLMSQKAQEQFFKLVLDDYQQESLCTRTLFPTQHLTLNWTNLKELRIFGCLVDVKFWEPFTTAFTTAESLVIVDVATDGRALQASIAKHVPLLEWTQFGICKQSDEEFEHKDYDPDDDDGFSNDGNVARYMWLGRELEEDPYLFHDMDEVAFDHPDCYEICARLSFEHGLKKLEGLRKLRELNVSRIDHKMRGRELK